MLTFTCPNCGTVTTISVETKPYKPEMEYKSQMRMWWCGYCGVLNQANRLTCNNCHRDKQGAVEVAG